MHFPTQPYWDLKEERDSLSLLWGIWIDDKQRLYVADYGFSRLAIYDLK
jgi:hypothetical protein